MSKQSDRLMAYLKSGKDRRSPSLKNLIKHSGYANNRSLLDGLARLVRIGEIVKDENGYHLPLQPRKFYLNGYWETGGTT